MSHHANIRREHERMLNMDRLADRLAEGYDVPSASKAIGVSPVTGNRYFRLMREALGPQAR